MSEETRAQQLVVFTLGTDQYALPIEQVQEIIRYHTPRVVTSPDPAVRGVISLRGKVVPVYDISEQLGADSNLANHAKIVIVEYADATAGVIVDEVDEVLAAEDAQFEALPETGSTIASAVVKLGDRLIVLVDLAATVNGPSPAGTAAVPSLAA